MRSIWELVCRELALCMPRQQQLIDCLPVQLECLRDDWIEKAFQGEETGQECIVSLILVLLSDFIFKPLWAYLDLVHAVCFQFPFYYEPVLTELSLVG